MANNGSVSIDKVRKKVTYTHDLISTSYHEAGHAVYALLHCMKVPLVYVFENKKYKRVDGFTHYESFRELNNITDPALFEKQIYAEICIKYAGLTAEKYHFKNMSGSDKFPMVLRDGSSSDTLSAAALIKQYNLAPPGRKRYSFKKTLIKETLIELRQHWDAVTLISHSLFKKKRLNYEDIKMLLIRKTKDKEFWKNQFKAIDYIFDNVGSLDEKEIKFIL